MVLEQLAMLGKESLIVISHLLQKWLADELKILSYILIAIEENINEHLCKPLQEWYHVTNSCQIWGTGIL